MKQHITPEQLNELSEKGHEKLRKWYWKHYPPKPEDEIDIEITYVAPNIGQMIEFLDEQPLNDDETFSGKIWIDVINTNRELYGKG